MPKISVVMPAYNAEKYIREAIDSILNQTFNDFEFIIINDGSTDNTKKIIKSYNDSRIVYLENEKNSGIVYTLNKGLEYAKGEYIARMDSDDIAICTRLEKQFNYLELHNNIGVLGTGIEIFGNQIKSENKVFSTNPEELKVDLIFASCIAHPTVMIRKVLIERYNIRYDELPGIEDYALWWKLSKITQISTLPDILLRYRVHKNQITQKKDKKYYELTKLFLDRRLETLKISLSKLQKKAFLGYCNGEFDKFDETMFFLFVDTLKILIDSNKKNKYFDNKLLKENCFWACNRIMNSSEIFKNKKYNKYVIKNKICPINIRIKLFFYKLLKH